MNRGRRTRRRSTSSAPSSCWGWPATSCAAASPLRRRRPDCPGTTGRHPPGEPPAAGRRPELRLRLVLLLVAEDALAALPNRVGGTVGLLVEATTGSLVDLFLTLVDRLVRFVAESLHVHVDHLLRGSLPPNRPTRQPQRRAVGGGGLRGGVGCWPAGAGAVVGSVVRARPPAGRRQGCGRSGLLSAGRFPGMLVGRCWCCLRPGDLERELVPRDGDEPDAFQGERLVGGGHHGHALAGGHESEGGDAAGFLHDGGAEAGDAAGGEELVARSPPARPARSVGGCAGWSRSRSARAATSPSRSCC